ncbi:MAG TPA: FkbM family methyltransferase [Chitinophagaceae bacterium]|nr:FkbM family methyltransferase [Chitinophagaceae bacterium]
MKEKLLRQAAQLEKLANGSKLTRLLHSPFKYVFAIFYRSFIYKRTGKELLKDALLFFGKKMKILLPSSTDIYLVGGKSHPSETRLAKFLIRNLNEGDHFIDIGAHYGYFSILASQLIGFGGKVFSYEPSSESYQVLLQNSKESGNIMAFQKAVSDINGKVVLYEFANLYSEYNTLNADQFKNTEWIRKFPPKETTVHSITLDQLIKESESKPKIIKIDAEGAEYKILSGAINMLSGHHCIITMEYLSPLRSNQEHKKAVTLLQQMNYDPYRIETDGSCLPIQGKDIDSYLQDNQLESDNIVFSHFDISVESLF